MSDLVGNPEDGFSRDAAHLIFVIRVEHWQNVANKKLKNNNNNNNMSRDARKPVFGVSDRVRHKPACTGSEKS